MKNISRYKVDKTILIPIIVFALISIITLYGASSILPSYMGNLVEKQSLWYVGGFILAYIVMTIGNTHIYRLSWVLYILGIISLIGLFFFGVTINESTCWYEIKGIGTIQPSEFMKIILIITIASLISKFNGDFPNPSIREEFFFLIKILI
ncbi:MAG: FtsW/RodA/SpoVE family cell cycle protein, partial [Clostridium sp.]|uniref:FtsW/RodA/SpoVE family cell cycle protein n=1 Tax=Clostridium sp. TaxID=1506 RepID=UPI0025C106DB